MTNVAPKRRPPNAGKGRPKGVPNKTTAAVKEALSLAFQGIGGVKAMTDWANDNQTEFYKLFVKMLPQEMAVTGSEGGPLEIAVRFVKDKRA